MKYFFMAMMALLMGFALYSGWHEKWLMFWICLVLALVYAFLLLGIVSLQYSAEKKMRDEVRRIQQEVRK